MATMAEPSGNVVVHWPAPDTGGRNEEPTEKDPQVQTMYDVTLQVGDKWTFEVEYRSFEGSAKISVTTPTERRSMSGRSRYGRLRFTIEAATTAHTGIYTVEVFDERRRKYFSQNPAKTTFEVTVNKPQCDCSLL